MRATRTEQPELRTASKEFRYEPWKGYISWNFYIDALRSALRCNLDVKIESAACEVWNSIETRDSSKQCLKTHSVSHRKHVTSPPQSSAG
jgi:hypothetical protein